MAERMGKAQMVQVVAEKAGITRKQAGTAVDAMLDAITDGVRRGSVSLPGLGTFSVVDTKERQGVRPGTKDKINIPAGKRLKFKPSSSLKGAFAEGGRGNSGGGCNAGGGGGRRGRRGQS